MYEDAQEEEEEEEEEVNDPGLPLVPLSIMLVVGIALVVGASGQSDGGRITMYKSRVVGVGDLHGDFEQATRVLELTKVVRRADDPQVPWKWVGGEATLVQLGDLVDRGKESLKLMRAFEALKREAQNAGGQVVTLLGNHELLNMEGNIQYVDMSELEAVGQGSLNLGLRLWKKMWQKGTGMLFKIASEYPVAAVVGTGGCQTLFSHAGLHLEHLEHANRSLDRMHEMVLEEIDAPNARDKYLTTNQGPLWHRNYADEPESEICDEVAEVLRAVKAKRMIIGHNIQDDGILTKCGGLLGLIDVGISSYYNSAVAAWVCYGSKTYSIDATGLESPLLWTNRFDL